MVNRKLTFKLYPNAKAEQRLTGWIRLHCELYNAALEERIDAWRKASKSISYFDQQNSLPEIKAARPEFVELGSHALQQTLRRLDLAFGAFYRRCKAGQTPGFPRFKANKRSCAVLATEELRVADMTRSASGSTDKPGKKVRQKAGLNREILSAGLSMAHQMIAYKAQEAGTRLHVANTRTRKPSQRCAMCWQVVKKSLSQRRHVCPCGHVAGRDQNSAMVMLIDSYTPGSGVPARPKPLARKRAKSKSLTRETPSKTA